MSDHRESTGGIFSSLRRILDGGLALVQNRVELFAVELHEEKCRLVEAILLVAALAALGSLTLAVVTVLVVLFFWDGSRLAALAVLAVLYAAATLAVWRRLRARLDKPAALSQTVEEIKKDRECLDSRK